jgi:two-component system alkaline phosphatase synthesis response regulator PhoP
MSLSNISSPDRQIQNQLRESDIYDDGYLRVEHRNYYVSCAGQPLKLPRTEFLIFSRLARSPERIVPVEELWEYAWGREKPLNTESLHVYIYRLRHKLVPYGLSIETMVNVGYRLLLKESANGQVDGNLVAKT